MTRKLALLLAAIVLPGGLIALLGLMVVKALSQTERGRKVVALAQRRMAVFRGGAVLAEAERQAA